MYNNQKDFIKSINEVTEQIEYLKLLLTQKDQVDEKSILEIERTIEGSKLNIIKFLSNRVNYQEWKDESNNNSLILARYVKEGYFDNEIGFDGLKDKILLDFNEKLEKVSPEAVLTLQEKKRQEYYNKNDVSLENRGFSKEVIDYVKGLHDKEKCFNRKFEQFEDLLPTRISGVAREYLNLIKTHPIILKDHKNHYHLNRPQNLLRSSHLKEVLELVKDSSMGDNDATDILTLLIKKGKELLKGKSIESSIIEIRQIAKDNKNSNQNKQKLN